MTEFFLNPADFVTTPQIPMVNPPHPAGITKKTSFQKCDFLKRGFLRDSGGVRGIYHEYLGGRYEIGGV